MSGPSAEVDGSFVFPLAHFVCPSVSFDVSSHTATLTTRPVLSVLFSPTNYYHRLRYTYNIPKKRDRDAKKIFGNQGISVRARCRLLPIGITYLGDLVWLGPSQWLWLGRAAGACHEALTMFINRSWEPWCACVYITTVPMCV